jgi:hypothetical protein
VERGARGGGGGEAGRKRGDWWVGRGLRTWAEGQNAEQNAGPHVGEKTHIVVIFFLQKKTQNLAFRMYCRALAAVPARGMCHGVLTQYAQRISPNSTRTARNSQPAHRPRAYMRACLLSFRLI